MLESWSQSQKRPWVVVVESTRPGTQISNHQVWERIVFAKGYRLAYFDGLNRFYVHESHPELFKAFDRPPNVFDNFAFSGKATHPFNKVVQQKLIKSNSTVESLKLSIDEAKNTISNLKNMNSRLIDKIDFANEKLSRLTGEYKSQKSDFMDLVHAYGELSANYKAIQKSLSWRLTSPLRGLSTHVLAITKLPRRFANRFVFSSINLFKIPIHSAMSRVLRNEALSVYLNTHIKKFPYLHQHLRSIAYGENILNSNSIISISESDLSISARAARIHVKLSRLIEKRLESDSANRN
ncbi:hypothetical protein [Diaphorobacter aerolatus]|uniref:hypothetical protein n=1 Tax=Diaphorobacter aerolatus TaxID=1288495 RepID=UPI001D004071|nr:hypothetical protein [Diaphorobacter aerolatus]